MEIKFKRSLLGYNPKAVEKIVNSIHKDFEEQLRDLEEEYSQGEYDVQSLKDEIKELKSSMTTFQALEEELSKILVSAHLAACTKVMDALSLADQMEEGALNKVSECEKETTRLEKTMHDITREIQSMTKRYSLALEGSDGE